MPHPFCKILSELESQSHHQVVTIHLVKGYFIVSRLIYCPLNLRYSSAIFDQPRFWSSCMRKTIVKSTESLGLPISILSDAMTSFAQQLVYLVSPQLLYPHLVNGRKCLTIYQILSGSIVNISADHLKAGMSQYLL